MSLKDAFLKAGIISKEKLEQEKEQKRKDKLQKTGPTQHGIHAHHLRTDCMQCKRNSPDVEFYEHNNRQISQKWLCVTCADQYWINDDCRQTAQSQHSRAGSFRRFFGRTKKFPSQK